VREDESRIGDPGIASGEENVGVGARTVVAILAMLLLASHAHAVPRRIVSLNLCTDELLLDLVPRERIAAVSHLAADPLVSAVADRAQTLPATRGEAESVLALDPDLVVAGTWTTPATLDLLERIGRRVLRVPLASDIAGIRESIRRVAAAVDEKAKGEALIGAFEADLRAAEDAAPSGRTPSALIYQVNGLSAGTGSLADALMRAAGLSNHAVVLGRGPGGALPLEVLAADPPDLVILSGPADEYRTVVAENLRHPALSAVLKEHASVTVPWRLWLCGTHYAGRAVRLMADARRQLPHRGPGR
jgi:iron complex transport system substrate-binding protein